MVSIIIPVYNAGNHIEITIRKLLSAIDDHSLISEIILVDDNSQDNTCEVIKNIIIKSEINMRLIYLLKNFGQHAATLTGIREASGIYCLTMDDDIHFSRLNFAALISETTEDKLTYLVRNKDVDNKIKYKIITSILNMISGTKNAAQYGSSQRFFKPESVRNLIHEKYDFIYLDVLFLKWGLKASYLLSNYLKYKHEQKRYTFIKRLKLLLFSFIFYRIALLITMIVTLFMALNAVIYFFCSGTLLKLIFSLTILSALITISSLFNMKSEYKKKDNSQLNNFIKGEPPL